MTKHTAKPWFDWRESGRELVIVVVGVFIALLAQQLVEALHWRNEVAAYRKAIHGELSVNLGTYPYRAKQEACIAARLDELQRWLDGWRSGHPRQIAGTVGIPLSRNIRTSVWDGADAAMLSHLPLNERLFYGFLYSEFANNDLHRLDERATWIELNSFNGAKRLDHQDQIRLQGLIYRARLRDTRIGENYRYFSGRAAEMGLRPKADPLWPRMDPTLCRPIL